MAYQSCAMVGVARFGVLGAGWIHRDGIVVGMYILDYCARVSSVCTEILKCGAGVSGSLFDSRK